LAKTEELLHSAIEHAKHRPDHDRDVTLLQLVARTSNQTIMGGSDGEEPSGGYVTAPVVLLARNTAAMSDAVLNVISTSELSCRSRT